jgi:hypothetical protein
MPLQIGLSANLQNAVGVVVDQTTSAGRILWEESCAAGAGSATALLPLLTVRQYLTAAGEPENRHAVLQDGQLCGQSIVQWTDAELESFARRYNVGWVMVFAGATAERFDRWPAAQLLRDLGECRLYAIKRPMKYVLKGAARSFEVDRHRITLADVVPEHGEVVLSLHYHESLRARPGWVRIEREPDAHDPVPLIRLKMAAPAARVTLTWEPK